MLKQTVYFVLVFILAPMLAVAQTATNERYERGSVLLGQVYGNPNEAENLTNNMKDIAPDIARFIIEFAYGDVYSRGGLDMRSREIATIAALTAMGTARPQLKSHIAGGLNVGLSPEEITEVIQQMVLYPGFPAALNALDVAREVFEERNINFQPTLKGPTPNRTEVGEKLIGQVYGNPNEAENLRSNMADIAPDIADFIIEFAYGDIYSRSGLDMRSREIATIAALTAMGNARPQLKSHIAGGLSVGLSEEEITEVILQMVLYPGFPAALNALDVAREVFQEENVNFQP